MRTVSAPVFYLFIKLKLWSPYNNDALPIDGGRRNLRLFPPNFRGVEIYFELGFKAWPHTKLVWKLRGDPLRDWWDPLSRKKVLWKNVSRTGSWLSADPLSRIIGWPKWGQVVSRASLMDTYAEFIEKNKNCEGERLNRWYPAAAVES